MFHYRMVILQLEISTYGTVTRLRVGLLYSTKYIEFDRDPLCAGIHWIIEYSRHWKMQWFYLFHSMFKKFSKEDVHSRSNIKSSVQRNLKTKFVSHYTDFEPVIDELIPKKSQAVQLKCEDRIHIYTVENKVILFEHFDDLIPALKVVHNYPGCFPRVQVDRGAIKFVLQGANIMCPGLTSPGAFLPEENLEADKIVTIYAEGKKTALAVGKLIMSTDEIKSKNKGVGIEVIHFLGDGLWNFRE